jgi:WD40 repeat protein
MPGFVKLWDLRAGQEKAALSSEGKNWVWSVAFSPDGQTMAIGRDDGIVTLWNTSTEQVRARLKGHTATIMAVAFSPDGKTLASGSVDGNVKLWDVATGQERITLKGHTDAVYSVAFAPDGLTLATGSADTTVKVWHAAADKEALAPKSELDPHDPESSAARNNAGDQLWQAGHFAEAKEVFDKTQRRLEKLAAHFPDVPDYRQELVHALFGLSRDLARDDAQSDESDKIWRRLVALV